MNIGSVFARPVSIRGKLLRSMVILILAVLVVGGISLASLISAERRLAALHQLTVTKVSEALDMSERAAFLAANAPYLLTLESPAGISSETTKILAVIDAVSMQIERSEPDATQMREVIGNLRQAITTIETSARQHAGYRLAALRKVGGISGIETGARNQLIAHDTASDAKSWAELQQMAITLLGAANTNNLVSLGEFNRRYLAYRKLLLDRQTMGDMPPEMQDSFAGLEGAAIREPTIFDLRKRELVATKNIDHQLTIVQEATANFAAIAREKVQEAEAQLSDSRSRTLVAIQIAAVIILAILFLAALLAFRTAGFVSRYISANIVRISSAMKRLASGDRTTRLQYQSREEDEISNLFDAFRVFRVNALLLDRRTRSLQRQHDLLTQVFTNISDGLAVTNAEGQIVTSNARFAEILRQKDPTTLTRKQVEPLIADLPLQSSDGVGGAMQYHLTDDAVIEARQSQLPHGGKVWLLADITERKQVDARLEEIRRIESLGKISGEVAHDFGNILSTLSGNLHLLENGRPEQTPGIIARMNGAIDVATSLTNRLLAFARKQHLAPEDSDLGQLVDGMLDLIEIALPDHIKLEVELPEDETLIVRTDPGQLESAILNLCINSAQAIEGEGLIKITVRRGDDGEIRLEIADNGCGMTPDILRQATEPFFTMRRTGNGTGLGLSMVRGFMEQTGGALRLSSEPGEGTVATMIFPQTVTDAMPNLSGRALIVDDIPQILEILTRQVRECGLTAVTCSDAEKALEILGKAPEFTLLITDQNLANGQSGWQLAETALERFPALRVLVLSTSPKPDYDVLKRFNGRITVETKPFQRVYLQALSYG